MSGELELTYRERAIVGVDEVGRGALAGPVTVAAVVLDGDLISEALSGIDNVCREFRDSKKVPKSIRAAVASKVYGAALVWNIVSIPNWVIDNVGIRSATLVGMKEAAVPVAAKFDFPLIIVDGVDVFGGTNHHVVAKKKADNRSWSVAAASLIAKVTRDALMTEIHLSYDDRYGFDVHFGYGTKTHLKALEEHGPSEWHRMSFKPCRR